MDDLIQLFSTIKEHVVGFTVALAAFGIVVDFTPWIKINPIRGVLKFISNKLKKFISSFLKEVINECTDDIRKKLDEQDKKIDEITNRFDEKSKEDLNDKIDEVRWKILDFGNAISKRDYDKEAYDHIISLHDWYDKTIKEKGIPNGRMDITYAFIVDKYNEQFIQH